MEHSLNYYHPKSKGITALKYAVKKTKNRKNADSVTITMEQAKQIIEQSKGFHPVNGMYTLDSNSVRGAAVILSLSPNELIQRLNCNIPSKIMNDLAHANNQINELKHAGNLLVIAGREMNATDIHRWNEALKAFK